MFNRAVALEGGLNLRDFGGYATSDGRAVRRGVLFRSGHLAEMTASGRAQFKTLDIRVICDLRRHDERDEDPTPFPEHDPRLVHAPIDPGSSMQLREALNEDPSEVGTEDRVRFMVEINRELARDHSDRYAEMIRALLETRDGGFLVHCTAGKDRTGFGVALIQRLLGVGLEKVMEDFLLTNVTLDFETFLLPRWRDRLGVDTIDVEAVKALSGVREEYLRAALEEVDRVYGSFDGYVEHLGLGAAEVGELRSRYLTDPA